MPSNTIPAEIWYNANSDTCYYKDLNGVFKPLIGLDIAINDQLSSYTLLVTDVSKLIRMNVSSSNNLTIPTNTLAPIEVGEQLLVTQWGAGQTTILASSGVTIRSADAKVALRGQYSTAALIKVGTNEWLLSGDIG